MPHEPGPQKLELEILEALLLHGADPTILFKSNRECHESLFERFRTRLAVSLEPHKDPRLCRLEALLTEGFQLPIRPNKREVESLEEEPCKRWKGS